MHDCALVMPKTKKCLFSTVTVNWFNCEHVMVVCSCTVSSCKLMLCVYYFIIVFPMNSVHTVLFYVPFFFFVLLFHVDVLALVDIS